ncbi:hypothetical protein AX16_009051 [Volvariella volvacea WC 439]|nr:hypothetical protein AX16_009051 [Volvariella volvacea WC 439]
MFKPSVEKPQAAYQGASYSDSQYRGAQYYQPPQQAPVAYPQPVHHQPQPVGRPEVVYVQSEKRDEQRCNTCCAWAPLVATEAGFLWDLNSVESSRLGSRKVPQAVSPVPDAASLVGRTGFSRRIPTVSMSLLRLPFLWSITWGIHLTVTPPNPPPSFQEQLKPTGFELLLPHFPIVPKVFFLAAAASETAVILAYANPTSAFSMPVINALLHPLLPTNVISTIRITPLFLLGWALIMSGALIRRTCYQIMGKQFTFELGVKHDHKLITSGPYSIVRHPSYTGALAVAFGTLICHFTAGSWLVECSGTYPKTWGTFWNVVTIVSVVGVIALARRMVKEDEMLQKCFGEEWEKWKEDVAYQLIPGVY